MEEIFRVFSAISGLRPSWGTLVIAVLIILSILISLTRSKGEILKYLFSLYISYTIFSFVPFSRLENIEYFNGPFTLVSTFVLLFALVSLLIDRSPIRKLLMKKGSFPSILILTIFGMGFFLSILTNMYNLEDTLGITVNTVFGNEIARLIWSVIPLIGIIFLA